MGEQNRLEGYLFPDTYEFFVNDTPENVLAKLLDNFEAKVDEELLAQIDTLNASLTEKSGQQDSRKRKSRPTRWTCTG